MQVGILTAILTAISPVALATLVNSQARSAGISFIKNFAAVSMQWGVLAICFNAYTLISSSLALNFSSGLDGAGLLMHIFKYATPVLSVVMLAITVAKSSEITIKAPDEETAIRRFKTLDITATNTFNRIGNTGLRALTSRERIEMLKDFFIGSDDMPVPEFDSDDYARCREKLACAPDYFDFKKDYFMFNDTYAKTLYIREYPSTATSDILI